VAFYPSAPALDKVCLDSWPRAQGWPCAGFGLWHRLGFWGGCASPLAIGRVSVWVSLSGGIGLWPCFSPDKPARWRKTKHPTFEAFTKTKNLCYLLDPETSG